MAPEVRHGWGQHHESPSLDEELQQSTPAITGVGGKISFLQKKFPDSFLIL